MRLYKIIDEKRKQDAVEFYNHLEEQRVANNKEILANITCFEWDQYLGYQGGLQLLPTYTGFFPKQKLKQPPQGWKFHKDHSDCIMPDKRTKEGKRIAKQLDELVNYRFHTIYDKLNIIVHHNGRFTIPGLIMSHDKSEIYLKLDAKVELKKKDFEEVTLTYVKEKIKKPKKK